MATYTKIHQQIEAQLGGGVVDKYGKRHRVCLPEGQTLTREQITQDILELGICKVKQLPNLMWAFTNPNPEFKWSQGLWCYYEKGIHRYLDKLDERLCMAAILSALKVLNLMREGYRFFAFWSSTSSSRVFRFDPSNNNKGKYDNNDGGEWDGVISMKVSKVAQSAISGYGKHGNSHTFKLSQSVARYRSIYNKHA